MNYGEHVVSMVCDELGIEVVSVSRSNWGTARCPLHEDRSPSFMIHLEEGGWTCLSGCGSSGDLAALVTAATGEDLKTARRRLRRAIPVSSEALKKALTPKVATPKTRQPSSLAYTHGVAPQYMLSRGFTTDTLKAWDIGWDGEEGAVIFPIKRDDELVAIVQRRLRRGPKYYIIPNTYDKSLFGIEHVPADASHVFLVEGPMDAVWLWQCGFPAVATLGSSITTAQVDALARRFSAVTFAFDADVAGIVGREKGAQKLYKLRLNKVLLPRGRKDVQECSCEELTAVLNDRVDIWVQ